MSKAIIDEALVEAGIEPTKARAATNAVLEKIVDELIENGRFTLTSIGSTMLIGRYPKLRVCPAVTTPAPRHHRHIRMRTLTWLKRD